MNESTQMLIAAANAGHGGSYMQLALSNFVIAGFVVLGIVILVYLLARLLIGAYNLFAEWLERKHKKDN